MPRSSLPWLILGTVAVATALTWFTLTRGGASVAIDATYGIAIAGSPNGDVVSWGDPIADGGAIRIFYRDANGAWVYQGYHALAGEAGELHAGDHHGTSSATASLLQRFATSSHLSENAQHMQHSTFYDTSLRMAASITTQADDVLKNTSSFVDSSASNCA